MQQKDYHKIHHRRVQQEKSRLNSEIEKLKKVYEKYQEKYKEMSHRYEAVVKEKMLMKLEKQRLIAKYTSLERNLAQLQESTAEIEEGRKEEKKHSPIRQKKERTLIGREIGNPHADKAYDPINFNLSLFKTYKGHLMTISALAFSPRKDILATASDDTTWKLWTVPNGELIMCGEGHQVWSAFLFYLGFLCY
jgi:sperm-associated antigen 16 protein